MSGIEKTWEYLHRTGATPSSKKKIEAPLDIDAPSSSGDRPDISAGLLLPRGDSEGCSPAQEVYKMKPRRRSRAHQTGHRWGVRGKVEWQSRSGGYIGSRVYRREGSDGSAIH
jgi:hypothetical protein